jgi:hypothetical protein
MTLMKRKETPMASWQEALRLAKEDSAQISGSHPVSQVLIVNEECLNGDTSLAGSVRWNPDTQTHEVYNVNTQACRQGLVSRREIEDAMFDLDIANSDWYGIEFGNSHMAEQTRPVEVLTFEQYQQARQSGKDLGPGTLVMVPVSLLNEMQGHQAWTSFKQGPAPQMHKKPDEGVVVEMTYVGQHTRTHLWAVQQGGETLATLKRRRRILGLGPGDASLNLDEAINILERSQGVQKTVEELKTEMLHYQQGLLNIEREPDAYVLPEIARGWYEQQLERVRQLSMSRRWLQRSRSYSTYICKALSMRRPLRYVCTSLTAIRKRSKPFAGNWSHVINFSVSLKKCRTFSTLWINLFRLSR